MKARAGHATRPFETSRLLFIDSRRVIVDQPARDGIRPGGLRQRFVGPERAHSGNAWTPVISWAPKRIVATANSPLNPVVNLVLSMTAPCNS